MITDHYYIKELIERQEKRSEDRTRARNIDKEREEQNNLINDSKEIDVKDFWCSDCKKDFKKITYKQIETDWNNPSQKIAFYKTKCKCGKWCMRYITNRLKDPYWSKSAFVGRDRGSHYKDLLQSFQSGYNLCYGKN